ncbi:hypothetical protein [Synechococcus sp. UW140]|uniref:hypothetical protein n=1 Tax=Synechococcus sp. UW140 TaxID=368503 RepID=UPI0010BD12EA|nr:hypothetical protein [Synechococcus sp. UW140]
MFLASLMAVGDAAQDVFIASLVSAGSYASLLPVLFAIGWVCNLFAVLLALWSMEIYLPVVFTNLAIKQIPSDE